MAQFVEQGTIDLNAGDVGGDIQVTNAVSRRFVRDDGDGTFTHIDVCAYGTDFSLVEYDRPETGYDVQVQYWLSVCTDPNEPYDTELGTEIEYTEPYDIAPRDLEQAFEWAVEYVRHIDPSYL